AAARGQVQVTGSSRAARNRRNRRKGIVVHAHGQDLLFREVSPGIPSASMAAAKPAGPPPTTAISGVIVIRSVHIAIGLDDCQTLGANLRSDPGPQTRPLFRRTCWIAATRAGGAEVRAAAGLKRGRASVSTA